jgi:hypothetical protein
MDLSDHAFGQRLASTTSNNSKVPLNKPRHFRIPFCKSTPESAYARLQLSGYHVRYKKYNVGWPDRALPNRAWGIDGDEGEISAKAVVLPIF